MANVDDPRGFIPLHTGKPVRVRRYAKATGAAIYQGDLVSLAADGEVDPAANGGGKCLGVAAEYASSTDTEIAVYDDPDTTFIAQCDGSFALADVGLNADIVATTGSGLTSAHEVQSASLATTVSLPLKVIGLSPKPKGNVVGTNAVVEVKLNNCVHGNGDGSTGI